MRRLIAVCLLPFTIVLAHAGGHLPATVHKSAVLVRTQPTLDAPAVVTLKRNTAVQIVQQQGLWYQITLSQGGSGYVRINEVRPAAAGKAEADDAAQIFLTGRSGSGHVTETAGVRGLEESELRSAAFDGQQLRQMENNRVSKREARAYARQHDWSATRLPWTGEAPQVHGDSSRAEKRGGLAAARGALRSVGHGLLGKVLGAASDSAPKSEQEVRDEELALGPMVAGRVLGARPLWANTEAQQRVNVIGRWLSSQTSRPDLPWTFGVIDSPEFNAYAAPGGYILVTSGLYKLVANDQELASVLAHEITHVVQRDHYEVIRKQQMMSGAKDLVSSEIRTGGGLAGSLARDYVEKNGAAILLTSLDRSAEYRADEIGAVYLARAGMNPLAMVSILQKMLAVGRQSGRLAELYETHPPLDDRLDRIERLDSDKLGAYLVRPVQ